MNALVIVTLAHNREIFVSQKCLRLVSLMRQGKKGQGSNAVLKLTAFLLLEMLFHVRVWWQQFCTAPGYRELSHQTGSSHKQPHGNTFLFVELWCIHPWQALETLESRKWLTVILAKKSIAPRRKGMYRFPKYFHSSFSCPQGRVSYIFSWNLKSEMGGHFLPECAGCF